MRYHAFIQCGEWTRETNLIRVEFEDVTEGQVVFLPLDIPRAVQFRIFHYDDPALFERVSAYLDLVRRKD